MKTWLLSGLIFCCILSAKSQDYLAMAAQFQAEFKDQEAVVIGAETTYQFFSDPDAQVSVLENATKKLMSLRYNHILRETEVYNGNSQIQKFYASSNLKQKVSDSDKFCGRYTNEGLFYDDSRFCSHSLPCKEIGEVWDVYCSKKYKDARYVTKIFFQENYPLRDKKIILAFPEEIEFEILEYNLEEGQISRTQRKEGNMNYVEFSSKALPAMKTDRYERGVQYNRPHILVLVKSVSLQGQKKNILSSTQDLYQWNHSLVRELKPDPQIYKPLVEKLTEGQSNDEDKVKAIYYWVQDNIRYIAFEDGLAAFKPAEAQDVFEKRYGDCKGMANLLREMLRTAGFDARLTWIGTRRIPYDQSIPSLATNNHMICTLLLGGKKYYLDATEKYIPFGENAHRIQERMVMIEDGDQYMLEKVPAEPEGHNEDKRTLVIAPDGENLVGQYTISLSGEVKKDLLYAYHYTQTDRREEYIRQLISGGNKKIKADKIQLPDLSERSGPLSISCDLTLSGQLSIFNNEYYIDPDPSKSFNKWTTEPDRQGDIDFGERINEILRVELQLPPGYRIASLPENLDIADPEFAFSIRYESQGDKILYTKTLRVPEGIIRKKSFERWNSAVKQLTKAYGNQIVLKK